MTVLLYDAQGNPLVYKQDEDEIPPFGDFSPYDPQPGVACQGCGCTDDNGCAPDGCFWVAPGWCAACCPETASEYWFRVEGLDQYLDQVLRFPAQPPGVIAP